MQLKHYILGRSAQDIYDLTGKTFGNYTVLSLAHIYKGRRFWKVRCVNCGSDRILPSCGFTTVQKICWTCDAKQFKESGLETPDWAQALGFDKTFWVRFWPRVNKNGPPPAHRPELGGCWLWTGGANGNGYGTIGARREGGKTFHMLVHRASLILEKRELIPDTLWALHKCDTPRCLRPEHLFLGDVRDNTDDMMRKGRDFHPFGEDHVNAKLTLEQVKFIKWVHSRDGMTYKDLALMFGCSPSNIASVVKGKSWQHVVETGGAV